MECYVCDALVVWYLEQLSSQESLSSTCSVCREFCGDPFQFSSHLDHDHRFPHHQQRDHLLDVKEILPTREVAEVDKKFERVLLGLCPLYFLHVERKYPK